MYKRLYRSQENKVLAGVFGGLGEYFNIDPVILRLFGILLIVATGILPGLLVYVVALFVVPQAPEVKVHEV